MTEDDKNKIKEAERRAYLKEKEKIAKRRGREKAQWDEKSIIEKWFGWLFD